MSQIITVEMFSAIIIQHSFISDVQSILLSKTNHKLHKPHILASSIPFLKKQFLCFHSTNDQHTAVIEQHGFSAIHIEFSKQLGLLGWRLTKQNVLCILMFSKYMHNYTLTLKILVIQKHECDS